MYIILSLLLCAGLYFIFRKRSDFAKKVKKKILSLFEIFNVENEGSDDERIEDYQKHLNKLRKFLEKITNRPTKYKELNSEY